MERERPDVSECVSPSGGIGTSENKGLEFCKGGLGFEDVVDCRRISFLSIPHGGGTDSDPGELEAALQLQRDLVFSVDRAGLKGANSRYAKVCESKLEFNAWAFETIIGRDSRSCRISPRILVVLSTRPDAPLGGFQMG
jgi:hypothetical protein